MTCLASGRSPAISSTSVTACTVTAAYKFLLLAAAPHDHRVPTSLLWMPSAFPALPQSRLNTESNTWQTAGRRPQQCSPAGEHAPDPSAHPIACSSASESLQAPKQPHSRDGRCCLSSQQEQLPKAGSSTIPPIAQGGSFNATMRRLPGRQGGPHAWILLAPGLW